MNELIVAPRKPARSGRTALIWIPVITALVLVFTYVARVSGPHGTVEPQSRRQLPPGQLQADARTVLAALDYLFHPDPAPSLPPTTLGADPGSFAFQPTTTSSMHGGRSNQADRLIEPLTNLPARS